MLLIYLFHKKLILSQNIPFFFEDLQVEMKKRFYCLRIAFLFLLIQSGTFIRAQEASVYKKNAFSFNLTRMAVNEINMGYEHWLSIRKSIEFSGGIIYVNDFLVEQTDEWTNAVSVSEHGFAARFHYKMYKRPAEGSKWQDYIAPGIVFKSLYYNDKSIVSEKEDIISNDSIYTIDTVIYIIAPNFETLDYIETFQQKRERLQLGIQFLWGKVYEASKTIAIEFYFGGGVNITMATRTDHSRYATYKKKETNYKYYGPDLIPETVVDDNQRRNQSIPDFVDKSLYARPSIQLGVKLRFRM